MIVTSLVAWPGFLIRSAPAETLPDLTATPWLVSGLDGQVPLGAMPPTLRFGTDGRVTGSTGCNRFQGRFVRDGRVLAISETATTRMACPPALMTQEARFLRALAEVTLHRGGTGDTVILADETRELFRLVPLR